MDIFLTALCCCDILCFALLKALMTNVQKRVMLKLLAVSAFLNHRDLRNSSAASAKRLRNDTDRVMSQPLTSESRAPLKTICMQVGLALVPLRRRGVNNRVECECIP